jgi:hypothetical protein
MGRRVPRNVVVSRVSSRIKTAIPAEASGFVVLCIAEARGKPATSPTRTANAIHRVMTTSAP